MAREQALYGQLFKVLQHKFGQCPLDLWDSESANRASDVALVQCRSKEMQWKFFCFWETIVILAQQVFQGKEIFYCGKMRQKHILVHLCLNPFFGQKHHRDVTCYAGYRDNDNTIASCDDEKEK